MKLNNVVINKVYASLFVIQIKIKCISTLLIRMSRNKKNKSQNKS